MSNSFGDFKNNEILELIKNKDPLGLNSDIERCKTAISEAPLMPSDETKMQYDAIPHYLKSATNLNNSADTNTDNTSPTLQVNNPIIRPIHSFSTGNLSRSTTSFKSFKNIQQSHKRSHTNSCNMDKILGIPFKILQNNLTIQSKSKVLIDEFNIKTREITKVMQGLPFSTTDLRNKLSRGCVTNNQPIITQVMV